MLADSKKLASPNDICVTSSTDNVSYNEQKANTPRLKGLSQVVVEFRLSFKNMWEIRTEKYLAEKAKARRYNGRSTAKNAHNPTAGLPDGTLDNNIGDSVQNVNTSRKEKQFEVIRGIKDSFAHGMTEEKAKAFEAVPEVIRKGKIIGEQQNWKGRGYDTALIVGNAKIEDATKPIGVIIKRDKKSNRYYMHEVLDLDEIKTGKEFSPGPSVDGLLGSQPVVYSNIADSAANVNTSRKEKQFEVINRTNRMTDDYHAGIRSASDIMSAEEAFNVSPDEYLYPDFTEAEGRKALGSGKITVYSSKPIEKDNNSNRYYVHDVIEDLKNNSGKLFEPGPSKEATPGNLPPITDSIGERTVNVNTSSPKIEPIPTPQEMVKAQMEAAGVKQTEKASTPPTKIPTEKEMVERQMKGGGPEREGEKAIKEMGLLGKVYSKTVDNLYGLGRAGEKLKIHAANMRKARGTADYVRQKGMVDMAGRDISHKRLDGSNVSLEKIFNDAADIDLEAFNDYLLHRHNIDRARQGKNVFNEEKEINVPSQNATALFRVIFCVIF